MKFLKQIFSILITSIFYSISYVKSRTLIPIEVDQNILITAKALKGIIDVFLFRDQYEVNFHKQEIGLSEKTRNLFDKLLLQVNGEFGYSLGIIKRNLIIHQAAFIFVHSSQLNSRYLSDKQFIFRFGTKPFKIFIYVDECSIPNLREQSSRLGRLTFFNSPNQMFIYYILNYNDYVHIMTVEWFAKNFCNTPQLIVLNTFNKITDKWNKRLESYEKFMEFNGCTLVLMTPKLQYNHHTSFWGYYLKISDDIYKIDGIIPKLFSITSERHNFHVEYQPAILQDQSFILNPDKKRTQLIVINNTAMEPTVFIEAFGNIIYNNKQLKATTSFIQMTEYLLVPPGEEYTVYEKLILPFDFETWTLLIFTFLFAFCAIFIINKLSKVVQSLFYGEEVRTPTLNLICIFFGISQTRLPNSSLARLILFLFVYFCLIFRTCFQSKMFEFMTSTPRRLPPMTLGDLIQRNYTVYSFQKYNLEELLVNELEKWPNIIQSYDIYISTLAATQSQIASLKISLHFNDLYERHFRFETKKQLSWIKMKEGHIITRHGVFMMPEPSFYFDMFEKILKRLIPNGIMKHIVDVHLRIPEKYHEPENEPKVLNMNDLAFGFNIWLGFCGISVICFIAEVLILILRIKWIKWQTRRRIKFAKVHNVKNCRQQDDGSILKPEFLKAFRVKASSKHMNQIANYLDFSERQELSAIIDEILNIECASLESESI